MGFKPDFRSKKEAKFHFAYPATNCGNSIMNLGQKQLSLHHYQAICER